MTLELIDSPLLEVQEAPQEAPDPERIARIRKHVQEAKRHLKRLHERIGILRESGALKDAEPAELAELKDRLAQLETMLVELSMAAAEAPPPRGLPGFDPRRRDPARGASRSVDTARRDRALVRTTLKQLLRQDPEGESARRALEWLESHAEGDAPRRASRTAFDRLVANLARTQQEETPIAEASRVYREALDALNADEGQVKPDNPFEEVEPAKDPLDARRREEFRKRQADELQRVNEMEVRYQDLRDRNEQLRARQQDLESKLAALQAELDRLRAKKGR